LAAPKLKFTLILTSYNPQPPITYTPGHPPIGMGWEGFDCIAGILHFLFGILMDLIILSSYPQCFLFLN
jgi:hypothetical protein